MKKAFLFLALTAIIVTTAKALPEAGKVYTIKAYFSNASYPDLYFSNSGSALVFNQAATAGVGDYWIARETGNTTYPWRFESGYGDGKFLSPATGLSTVGGYVQVNSCPSISGYYHLYGSTADSAGNSTIRNLATWSPTGASKTGFAAYGAGGCWGGGHNNSTWSTDFEIAEVSGVDVYTVASEVSAGGVTYGGTYTGTASQTDGGFYIFASAPAAGDFTAISVEGATAGAITVDATTKTINVSYTTTNEVYNAAKAVYNLTGVGYPSATATERAALKTVLDKGPTSATDDELNTAVANFKACTTVDMPEDGKLYTIDFVSQDQTKTWGLATSGTTASVNADAAGSVFVAHKYTNTSGNTRYIFVNNSDGYILAFRGATQYFDMDNAISEFDAGSIVASSFSQVTASTEQRFGKIYLTSDKRYTNNSYKGCFILKESTGAFDNSESPYYNGTFTSALSLTASGAEASEAAQLAIARFDALYAAKPYKSNFGTGLGTYSATLNGTAYTTYDSYANAVNGAASTSDLTDYAFELNGPEDGKVYKLYSYQNGGTLYQMANNSSVINEAGTTVDDNAGYWICHKTTDGIYTFESAMSDGKYFGWQGLADAGYQFDLTTGVNSNNFSLYSHGDTGGGRYLYVSSARGWNRNSGPVCNGSGSTDFRFEEVNAQVYTAQINGSTEAKLTYTGAGFTGKASVANGGFWVIKDGEATPALFSTSSYTGYTAGPITVSGQTVSVTYTLDTDALFSADIDNAVWLRVSNVENGNYTMYNAGTTLGTQLKNLASADQLVAFVGNSSEFKIYSRSKGNDAALYAANGDKSTAVSWAAVDEASTWQLDATYANADTKPGYGITLSGSSATGLNMFGGNGGDCKFWDYGATNYGSRWIFEIITREPTVSIELAKETKYPQTNYRWGTVSYTVKGATTQSYSLGEVSAASSQTLYITDASEISFSAAAYMGYEVNVSGSTVTFSGTDEERQFLAYTPKDNHPYRIPAIAKASNGDLLAVYDYRLCNNDVGYGEVDEVMRIGRDNGRSWENERTIADADGTPNSNVFGNAFGDPALVADSESGKVLMMCVSGKQVYSYATATSRPFIARVTSDDNGQTWNAPEDATPAFWGQNGAIFQNGDTESEATVYAYAGFFGAGRILQSSYKAPGAGYHRLYGAMLMRGKGLQGAYVVYSDDFGATWQLLGGDASVQPLSQSNEPKVEELPNGNILVSGRRAYGRCFNIFTFTDMESGTGSWGNGGNLNINNDSGTNGEVMVVKAVKASDNSAATLLLQSVPKTSGRNDVSIYYKDITNEADYDEVSDLTDAATWSFGKQMAEGSSAYSAMCIQQDGRIGFLYEGSPTSNNGYGYAMIYQALSVEEITGGVYTTPNTLSATYNSANGQVVMTGSAGTADNVSEAVNSAAGTGSVTSIDLAATYLKPSLADIQTALASQSSVSKNVLLYAPANANADNADNVVINGQCDNLVLTDKADFAPISAFTATAANYAKSGLDGEGWYSCVLPYGFDIPAGMTVLSNARVEGSVVYLDELTGSVAANTPFIYKTASTSVDFATSDASIGTNLTPSSGSLSGTYKLIGAGDATNKLIINSEGKAFAVATATATIPAFRAYIDNGGSGSKVYTIVIDNDPTGIIEIDGEGNVSSGLVDVYSVDGRLVRSQVDAATAISGLSKGIYIINGKKIKK